MGDYLKSDKAKSIWKAMGSGLSNGKEEEEKEKKPKFKKIKQKTGSWFERNFGKGLGSQQEDIKKFGSKLKK